VKPAPPVELPASYTLYVNDSTFEPAFRAMDRSTSNWTQGVPDADRLTILPEPVPGNRLRSKVPVDEVRLEFVPAPPR
jgi:hypothetical protein